MKNAIIRYVFDRKKEANNNTRTGLLQIEVRKQGSNECAYISTGIRLYKNQFTTTNGFTCVKHNNADIITGKGRLAFSDIEKFVVSEKCKEVKDARNYNKEEVNTELFLPFVRKVLARKTMSYGSVKNHNVLIHQIEKFGKFRFFQDLTYENIMDFDSFLNDGRRVLKQVMRCDADPINYVLCRSFNPSYGDEELPKSMIHSVWKVIKGLTVPGW